MLTYQLQSRVFKIEDGPQFTFPSRAEIELGLGPPTSFGTDSQSSRTLVRGHAANVFIDANTGRWLGRSDPALGALEVVHEVADSSRLTLNGGVLRYEFECADFGHLEGTLIALRWLFPTLLNLKFSEPPIVRYVRGIAGATRFRWEHRPEEWRIEFRPVVKERLETHVVDSFKALPLFKGILNRRLAAALQYFHISVRLNMCGDSPWEFMAESILNLWKCLAILFASSEDSTDDIRRELGRLGYTQDEIDGDFIPICVLRSHVDVAHPRVALFKHRDLQVLYRYVSRSEDCIRDLLIRVVNAVRDGSYSLRQDDDLSLRRREQVAMDRLVQTMNSRLSPPVNGIEGSQ